VTFLIFLTSVVTLEYVNRRFEVNEKRRPFLNGRYPESRSERTDTVEAASGDLHNLGKALESYGIGSHPQREAQPVKTPGVSADER